MDRREQLRCGSLSVAQHLSERAAPLLLLRVCAKDAPGETLAAMLAFADSIAEL